MRIYYIRKGGKIQGLPLGERNEIVTAEQGGKIPFSVTSSIALKWRYCYNIL